MLLRIGRKRLGGFVGEWLSAQPNAPLSHQPGGWLVNELAVLDALYSGGDSALNRSWRVGMHGDIGSPILRCLNGGMQFRFGESRHVERAVGRCHTSARSELNLRRAQHELFAY